MKKILTVVLLWTALCGTAFSQNASDFTVDTDGVITKYGGFDTVIVIPAVIGGKNITGIGKEAFLRADITKVTIPEGVTKIGDSAFSGNKLTAITIPDSVTEIGEEAFANNKLTGVTIPGSVKVIKERAFYGNTTLAKIVISEGVEIIYHGAFNNTKCTSISLPSTITYLYDNEYWGGFAFDLSAKPSFTLAANILYDFSSIPAFYSYIANDRKAGTYASNLPLVEKKTDDYLYYETRYGAVLLSYLGNSTRVRIPSTIGGVALKALSGQYSKYYYYYSGTFENRKLAAVQIPEGITYIGARTFSGNDLVNVTIPNSVTFIGGGAFYKCANLTSITIPNSVTYIGGGAFTGCEKLTSVTFEGMITSNNFGNAFGSNTYEGYIGDLREKYIAGGAGTYTRPETHYGGTWTKQ